MTFSRSAILFAVYVCMLGISCNRNSLELPPVNPPPAELYMSAKVNGIATIEFVFKKVTVTTGDTLKLFIRNNTMETLKNVHYMAELCQAVEQSFDSCNLQYSGVIAELKHGDSLIAGPKWINSGIVLDAKRINVGVLSIDGKNTHPLSGVYGNISAAFEDVDTAAKYYGQIRGYVLSDGTATFRIKSAFNKSFNATGLFTGMDAFDGQLTTAGLSAITYKLDSVGAVGAKKIIDTSNGKCIFRLKLESPIENQIYSILSQTNKN